MTIGYHTVTQNKRFNGYKYASKAVKHWAELLGFGHYSLIVGQLPPDEDSEDWANCMWSLEEEWAVIRFGNLSGFDEAQIDHLVLHELSHILIGFANAGAANEEAICNRIASSISGKGISARGLKVYGILSSNPAETMPTISSVPVIASAERPFTDDELRTVKAALPAVILRMQRPERELLCRIFFDGENLSSIGRDLGINRSTVMRRRDTALKHMKEHYEVVNGN